MKRQLGFTLVELIVVVLLFSIGVVVITSMFFAQNRLYRSQSAQLDVSAAVRFALDDIDNYTRQATRTPASYSTYTASSQTLILQIQSVNTNARLVPGLYDYVVYNLSGGTLTRIITADASSARKSGSRVVASNVTALTFTYNNANYTQVTEVATLLTCSESSGIQIRSFTDSSNSKLRAY